MEKQNPNAKTVSHDGKGKEPLANTAKHYIKLAGTTLLAATLTTVGYGSYQKVETLRRKAENERNLTALIEKVTTYNPSNALMLYEQYKHIPHSEDWFLHAANEMSYTKPQTLLQWDKNENLLRFARGKDILEDAVEHAEFTDKNVMLHSPWLWNSLLEMRDKLYLEILNDPLETVSILEKGDKQSATLLELIKNSASANVRALAEIDFNAQDTAGKYNHRGTAILLINKPDMTYEEASAIVLDNNRFLETLMNLKYDSCKFGCISLESVLQKSILKKIYELNSLHESPDAIRFASVDNITARELYMLIAYSNEEAFTSTYDGLFNRFMKQLKNEDMSPTGFLDGVKYDNWRKFVKLSLMYERLPNFLDSTDVSFQENLLERFVKNIDKQGDRLSQAVAVANIFAIIDNKDILKDLQATINSEYERVKNTKDRQAKELYGLLAGMFGKSSVDINEKWLESTAIEYKLSNFIDVSNDKLFNLSNIDVQEYFFYQDSDGMESFASFVSEYNNKRGWKVKDNGSYISISASHKGKKIEIFAAKPQSGEQGVDDMENAMNEAQLKPVVIVHRGHSTHVQETIKHMTSSAEIVFLGSCGDHNNIPDVLEKSPDASIITTTGTGDMRINDYLLKALNEQILRGRGIDWMKFWAGARRNMGRDPNFKYYVSPEEDLSTMFLEVYGRGKY